MKSNSVWILISGLAVGFIVGQRFGSSGGGGGGGSDARAGGKAQATTANAGPTQIPSSWIAEGDFGATADFKDLTPAQRYQALKVLNEKPCDCGCPHGSVALCKKQDPGCPRAPTIIATTVAMAKQGKLADEIMGALKKPDAPAQAAAPSGPQRVELASWTPVEGPKQAKVTIVEFSDFQCPFCSRVVPTLKEIMQKYPKDVRIAFRNQPLPFHEHAREAAEAAMAANAQGKFWPMHDKLFGNQQALSRADLDKYAQEIGLNMGKFKAAMDSHAYKDQIDKDMQRGSEVGASGTPTLFVNGQLVSGAQPFDAFKTLIDQEIKHADQLLAKGTSIDKLYDAIMAGIPKSAPAAAGAGAAGPAEHVDVAVGDAPVKGPAKAPVTIIEFSDFQCPFCSRVVPTLRQIEDEYKGKVRIAFKNQPLPFHNHAQLAAEAALAASEQGKFWEMHDKLFANQQKLDRPDLEQYAQDLGLNMSKFKAALDSGKFKDRIKQDSAEGTKLGAQGTPTLFVNGYKIVGAQPIDAFKKLIDQELAKKKG
jgi:protein-disulfide isomerase